MTQEQRDEVWALIKKGGMPAVKAHPVYGPLWTAEMKKSQQMVDADEKLENERLDRTGIR